MAQYRSSVPLDITVEGLKDHFSKQQNTTLKSLDDEKLKKFVEFLGSLHKVVIDEKILTEEEWKQLRESDTLDDMALYRYLYGYAWKMEDCVKMCKEMIEWERKYKPKEVRLKDVEEVAKFGYLFHHGHDKKNKPLLWMLLENDKVPNEEKYLDLKYKHLVHTNETCIRWMEKNGGPDTFNITWVVEIKGSSLSLSTVKATKHLFDSLGQNYPERVGQILILNPPWTASIIWSFVKPFLTQQQIDKYVFIKGSEKDIRQELLKYIDEDQLIPALYQGKSSFTFDLQRMIKEEAETLDKK